MVWCNLHKLAANWSCNLHMSSCIKPYFFIKREHTILFKLYKNREPSLWYSESSLLSNSGYRRFAVVLELFNANTRQLYNDYDRTGISLKAHANGNWHFNATKPGTNSTRPGFVETCTLNILKKSFENINSELYIWRESRTSYKWARKEKS